LKLLYIGNKLSKYGFTPTGVETLGEKLKELCSVILVSDKKIRIIRLFDMIWAIIKNRKTLDYVIFDTYSGKALYYVLICSILCQKLNKKYITILHGGNLPRQLQKNRFFVKKIFQNSLFNITPSTYLKNRLKIFGFKIQYIPNYIDFEKYNFKKRVKISPKLLWVRSFHKVYNPLMAIYVLKELTKCFSDAELCMVGPDKDGTINKCKNLAKELGILDKITFTGLLSKNDWISLSESYDIFINTTNYDNQPVSVIEAMALGFPIVSTNAGGLKYLHEEGKDVLFVRKNGVNEMAIKIKSLINGNYDDCNLSENSRKKAKLFSWDAIKNSWYEILLK
tara:strand:+ start:1292 stop:2302 length:1011 start_codon:yes stop_codon:yes gene_type:complete